MKRKKKDNIIISKLVLLSSSKIKIIAKLKIDKKDENITKKWENTDGQKSSE